MGQAIIRAGQRACVQIKPETQRGEQAQFPAHIERRPDFLRLNLV